MAKVGKTTTTKKVMVKSSYCLRSTSSPRRRRYWGNVGSSRTTTSTSSSSASAEVKDKVEALAMPPTPRRSRRVHKKSMKCCLQCCERSTAMGNDSPKVERKKQKKNVPVHEKQPMRSPLSALSSSSHNRSQNDHEPPLVLPPPSALPPPPPPPTSVLPPPPPLVPSLPPIFCQTATASNMSTLQICNERDEGELEVMEIVGVHVGENFKRSSRTWARTARMSTGGHWPKRHRVAAPISVDEDDNISSPILEVPPIEVIDLAEEEEEEEEENVTAAAPPVTNNGTSVNEEQRPTEKVRHPTFYRQTARMSTAGRHVFRNIMS